jgi:hypothetical protein
MAEAAVKAKALETTTAEDTLKRRSTDANVISGGHLVAKALKAEGVDTISRSAAATSSTSTTAASTRASASSTSATSRPLRMRRTAMRVRPASSAAW